MKREARHIGLGALPTWVLRESCVPTSRHAADTSVRATILLPPGSEFDVRLVLRLAGSAALKFPAQPPAGNSVAYLGPISAEPRWPTLRPRR